MNKTQKIIMYVTTTILAVLVLIILGKIFMFERGKEKPSGDVDVNLINKLYNYLPTTNAYQLDTVYSKYSTINNININTIETMIYNYIKNNNPEKLETFNNDELLYLGLDETIVTPLHKISIESLEYGLKMVFGENQKVTFKDVGISNDTNAKFYENYLYVYQHSDVEEDVNVVFRQVNKYNISGDKTIKIYDYYLKCDTTTNTCFNDDRKSSINNNIVYESNLVISNYKDKMQQYEHTFKYENGNYYWLNSKMV